MLRIWTRRLALVALLMAMAFTAKTGHLVADSDTAAPFILDFQISPVRVNTGIRAHQVTVSAVLVDLQSGISGEGDVRVQFKSPSGASLVWANFYHDVPGQPDALVDGTLNSGLWEVYLTLPQGAETGMWELEDLFLLDQAGNYRVLVANDMAAYGHATTFEVQNSAYALVLPIITQRAILPEPVPTVPLGLPTMPPN